jgi:hypothetical protein
VAAAAAAGFVCLGAGYARVPLDDRGRDDGGDGDVAGAGSAGSARQSGVPPPVGRRRPEPELPVVMALPNQPVAVRD